MYNTIFRFLEILDSTILDQNVNDLKIKNPSKSKPNYAKILPLLNKEYVAEKEIDIHKVTYKHNGPLHNGG